MGERKMTYNDFLQALPALELEKCRFVARRSLDGTYEVEVREVKDLANLISRLGEVGFKVSFVEGRQGRIDPLPTSVRLS